ncbi:MAG: hypothetical protein C5B60_07420 [Chloroflexi bacterium]|nr:MAG: hypothetical protein C5B60_07420 [Chloroflexota bacterium]
MRRATTAAPTPNFYARELYGAGRVFEKQKGKIRSLDLTPAMAGILEFAAAKTGLDVHVTSGGQVPLGQKGPRTGSTRHDVGGGRLGAADVKLWDPVQKRHLNMTRAEDAKRMQEFVYQSIRAGATGVGAATNYMGNETTHIGGGPAAVWGKAGGGAPAAWIRTAYEAGRRSTRVTQAEVRAVLAAQKAGSHLSGA